MPTNSPQNHTKAPRQILENIFAFSPNRETLGATSYFIVGNRGNILIDCPAWDNNNQEFLLERGGVSWLFLTHRGGIGKKVKDIQQLLSCQVIIQEQEAYLLPEVEVNPFQLELTLSSNLQALWTPGFSPGSSCLYYNCLGGVLFTGRHLLPNQQGEIMPLRTAKTFHWPRQLRSVEKLVDRFNVDTLNYICPGANTGFLRGVGFVADAYRKLSQYRQ